MGKVEVPIRLIIIVKNKNCEAYLVCSAHKVGLTVKLPDKSSKLSMTTSMVNNFRYAMEGGSKINFG